MLLHILLVDADPTQRSALEAALLDAGYIVTTVENIAEALAHLRPEAAPLDLVITDDDLPGIAGVEFLRVARLRRPDLPLIGLTAIADTATAIVAEDPALSGVRWLVKPVTPAKVVLAVQALFGAGAAGAGHPE